MQTHYKHITNGGKRMSKSEGKARSITLKVPKNIDLEEMSNDQIEELAKDMAMKAADGVPKNSTLLGIEKLVLTNSSSPEVGVWGQWSRACDDKKLGREGLVINPAVFEAPIREDIENIGSSKVVMQNKVKKTAVKTAIKVVRKQTRRKKTK